MNEEKSIRSVHEVKASETDRGIVEYSEALGLTVDQLQQLTENRTVMDLGAGSGVYAAEMELWKKLGYKSPLRVDSVNLRFAAQDYEVFLRDEMYKNGRRKLSLPPKYRWRVSKKVQDEAWRKAKEKFLGLDWNDLSSIADDEYSVIISVFAFPYYSDMQYLSPESPKEVEQFVANGSFFEFGYQNRKVFQGLSRILQPGGVMLLATEYPYSAWERSPKFQQEITQFINSLGCELETVQTGRSLSFRVKKPQNPN